MTVTIAASVLARALKISSNRVRVRVLDQTVAVHLATYLPGMKADRVREFLLRCTLIAASYGKPDVFVLCYHGRREYSIDDEADSFAVVSAM